MPKQETQPKPVSNRRRSRLAHRMSAAKAEATGRGSGQHPAKARAPVPGYHSKVTEILLSPLLK